MTFPAPTLAPTTGLVPLATEPTPPGPVMQAGSTPPASNRGRWRPGQSGNPRGRPPSGLALADYLRRLGGHGGEAYADRLHRIATGPNARLALEAIRLIAPYLWGKPAEVEVRISPEALASLTDEELQVALKVAERFSAA